MAGAIVKVELDSDPVSLLCGNWLGPGRGGSSQRFCLKRLRGLSESKERQNMNWAGVMA